VTRVAVVGAGIAGLAVAHAVRRRAPDAEVTVLEAASRPGGNIRSERTFGYLCEWGPNGFLDSVPETLAFAQELGLAERVHRSDDLARRRFIFRHGRLHLLPGGPAGFLRSGLLSWPGKLRIAGEPFAAPRPAGDETIHAFAARRIGREAADVLVASMVSGVFAGDARALSLRACFPKMWQMETEHGGLFRALFAKMRERRVRRGDAVGSPLGTLTSFRDGTEELVRAAAAALGPSLRLGSGATGLRRSNSCWRVEGEGGGLEADAVVLAAPPSASARLVGGVDDALAAELAAIPSAGLAVVALGYEERLLPGPLDGFGFLVPRGEGARILGVLWDSSIYPGRAPSGHALLRAMIGGALDPEAVRLEDAELLAVVRRDLQSTMSLSAEPDFVRIFRHPLGIPQYVVGHLDRLARIEDRLSRLPGLHLAGNGYRGVAINSCVAEAGPIAERMLAIEGAGASSTREERSPKPDRNAEAGAFVAAD
jgi:oxygen-dependent protoporphyrinogen oxidase